MASGEIGYISKKRNSGSRKARKIILMITEGNNRTETNYFKNFEYVYEKTKALIPTALENVEKLNNHCISLGKKPHTVEYMPSTEIDSVVKILI